MNTRRKLICFIFSVASLVLGLLIYVFLRNGTYMHLFLNYIDFFGEFSPLKYNNCFAQFLKYYLADFLWGISLSYFLSAISFEYSTKRAVVNSLVSITLGVLLELFQKLDIINGTADICDVFMYVAAGLIHAVFNIIFFIRR